MSNITITINVEKITKSKLFKGEQGTYLNAVLIETPDSKYSDFMIVEESTREERESGTKSKIIGNGKVLKPKQEQAPAQAPAPAQSQSVQEPIDDLPF